MKISSFEAFHVRIQLLKPIRHASHNRDDTDSIVVRCQLEDGTVGWGEGLPREYVTGETIDSAWKILSDTNWSNQLGGNLGELPEVVNRLQTLRIARPANDPRDCFGNSVACAVELSVLDAACRRTGVPLSKITEFLPETLPIRAHFPRVRYSAAFTAMSVYSQISRAVKLRLAGLHQAKVKTGVEGVDDEALLRRLRWILGKSFDLRIDANEAWTCENLQSKLAPLVPYHITSVEQPVKHEEVSGLAKLRGKIGVPLMLDESLCSLIDAHEAIDRGTCDLFNIRLSKCGGYLNSLKLAALADRSGLGYQLGCQVGETGILSAAGRHFATSTAKLRYLEGSFDRFLVRDRLTKEDITFAWGGYAPALNGPGLGITVDEQSVAQVTIRKQLLAIQ